MEVNLFQGIGYIIENIFSTMKNASLTTKFMQLQSIVGILIVLSIMYKGYQTLAGKAQDPIRDLAWDIARKLMILTFVMNVSGWLTASTSALSAIYEWAGGGKSFYAQLDKVTGSFIDTLIQVWEANDWYLLIIVIPIMLLSFVAIVATLFFTVISLSLTNTFLIIALPLALFCFMYENTRQVFVQWCNMFISNIFLLLFISIFMNFMISQVSILYQVGNFKGTSIWLGLLHCIFVSGILVVAIQVIKSLASNLAQVSLDSAGASATQGFLGSMGKTAGKGVGTAKDATLGMVSGSAAKAISRGGVAGVAAFGIKKLLNGFRNK